MAMLNAHCTIRPQLFQMVARASLFPGMMTFLKEQCVRQHMVFATLLQCEGQYIPNIDTHAPNSLFLLLTYF